jgi:hypothetical protein
LREKGKRYRNRYCRNHRILSSNDSDPNRLLH